MLLYITINDMDTKITKIIEGADRKKRPDARVGDTVRLHMKIKEGNKERIQIFEGVVIGMKAAGANQTITVRKISYGIGVERVVPFQSNLLEKMEVVKRGTVKRSKLFYLRDRVGKRALKVGLLKDVYLTDEVEVPSVGEEIVEEETVE